MRCQRFFVDFPDSWAILCFLGESFFTRLRFFSFSSSSSGRTFMVRNYNKKSLREQYGGFCLKLSHENWVVNYVFELILRLKLSGDFSKIRILLENLWNNNRTVFLLIVFHDSNNCPANCKGCSV